MIEIEYSPFYEDAKKFLKEILPDEKVLIFSDSDADGITSAFILKEYLSKLAADYKFIFTSSGKKEIDFFKEIIEREKPRKVIFLDLAFEKIVDLAFEYPDIDFLYIDHHLRNLPTIPKNLIFLDIRALGSSTIISCSSLVWRLVRSVDKDLDNLCLIAAIGAYADYFMLEDYDLINCLRRNYKEYMLPFGVNYSLILAAFLLNFSNRRYGKFFFKILDEAYKEKCLYCIFKNKKARKLLEKIINDISNILSSKNSLTFDKVVFVKTDNTVLAGEILRFAYKNKVIVAYKPYYSNFISKLLRIPTHYKVSVRNNLGKLDLGKILKDITSNYEDSNGGGHKNAAGGKISRKYFRRFIKEFVEYVDKELSKND